MTAVRSTRLITMYVLSLAVTITLLVAWVVYAVRSGAYIAEIGRRVTGREGLSPWLWLGIGCVLLFFLIVGLTFQLAGALAAARYARKQDEFVANITHEMKSPLAAIKLHAQTLQQQLEDATAPGGGAEPDLGASRQFLRTIEEQADRMAGLVDAVLETSRLVARKPRVDLAPIQLAGFFEAYLPGARAMAQGRGVALATRIEIPDGAAIVGSAESLRRVLDNLLDNAVRFSQQGGEVRLGVRAHAGRVSIEVEDDGIGIPPGELPNIFDRFYQVRRGAGALRQGSGLGLAIVSGLVREMKGTVRAFSREERPGTRLIVDLPLAGTSAGRGVEARA